MPKQIARDDELMQAVAAGNKAFAELQRRHRGRVFRLIRAFVHDDQHTEDLTQEVFCRLYNQAGNYGVSGHFIPWLKRMAINLAKNFLRRQRQSALMPLDECETQLSQDERFDPARALQSELLREEVRTALQSLPEEQRLVLVMRYFGGMSVPEIAWALQSPEGTVKSRLHYGLGRLRQALTAQEKPQGEPNS